MYYHPHNTNHRIKSQRLSIFVVSFNTPQFSVYESEQKIYNIAALVRAVLKLALNVIGDGAILRSFFGNHTY